MKRFLNVAKIIFPVVILFSLGGCFQYPEGPVFTVQTRDERINGAWRLVSATDSLGRNVWINTSETDTTGQNLVVNPHYENITLTIIVSRSGDRTWTAFQDANLISLGTFIFAEHGDQLIVAYTLLDNTQTYSQYFFDIRKLTDKYFYYVDQNGYTLHYQKY